MEMKSPLTIWCCVWTFRSVLFLSHQHVFHSLVFFVSLVSFHLPDTTGQENVRRKRNEPRSRSRGRSRRICSCQRSATGWRFESSLGRRWRWRTEITTRISFAHVGLCPRLLFKPAGRRLRPTGYAFPGGHERRSVQLLEWTTICRVNHWFLFLPSLSSYSLFLFRVISFINLFILFAILYLYLVFDVVVMVVMVVAASSRSFPFMPNKWRPSGSLCWCILPAVLFSVVCGNWLADFSQLLTTEMKMKKTAIETTKRSTIIII